LAPSFGKNLVDAGESPKALGLELGAEIPEIQARIHLAVERLGGDQRRRTIDDGCVRLQVDAVLLHPRLKQQPALVDGTAADGELAALEVGERLIGDAAGTITAPSALE